MVFEVITFEGDEITSTAAVPAHGSSGKEVAEVENGHDEGEPKEYEDDTFIFKQSSFIFDIFRDILVAIAHFFEPGSGENDVTDGEGDEIRFEEDASKDDEDEEYVK